MQAGHSFVFSLQQDNAISLLYTYVMDACMDAHILYFFLGSTGTEQGTVVSCIEEGVRHVN